MGGKFPFSSFLPFLMPQPQSNGHHGYRGGCNSEPQRRTKLWGTGTFLWDCKTCVVPREQGHSPLHSFTRQSLGPRHGQTHMKYVAKWLSGPRTTKGRSKELRSTKEIAEGKQLRKMAPWNCLWTLGLNPKPYKLELDDKQHTTSFVNWTLRQTTAQVSDWPLGGTYKTQSTAKTNLLSSDFNLSSRSQKKPPLLFLIFWVWGIFYFHYVEDVELPNLLISPSSQQNYTYHNFGYFVNFSTIDILQQVILLIGAILCVVRCSTASLASTH